MKTSVFTNHPAAFRLPRPTARTTRFLALSIGACLIAVANAHPPRITVIDAPRAGTGAYQGTGCFAYTDCSVLMNEDGAIAGYSLTNDNVFVGFVRSSAGKFTSFQAPGADTLAQDFNGTLPTAINEEGAITGLYYDANNLGHGFLRSPKGKFVVFDVPNSIAGTTHPIALNNEGEIVGYVLNAASVSQAFLRHPDGSIELWSGPGACAATNSTGCYGSGAFGINDKGTVSGGYEDNAGNFADHGLLRDSKGKFTSYEAPNAGYGFYQGTGSPGSSVAINEHGAVAGYVIDANNVVHGYLRAASGAITTFDVPGEGSQGIGCFNDCPIGLNNAGAITGYYLDANNVSHGFVRTSSGKVTSFDAPGANLTTDAYSGTFPVSINSEGAITGYFLDINNINHAFLRQSDDDK